MENNLCSCDRAVDHARGIMPNRDAIEIVAEMFKLCGDSTRVAILCALSRHCLCVNELASVLGMSSSAVSHQLRLLRQTGFIRSQRAGKSVVYSISEPHLEDIFSIALNYSEGKLK